MDDSIKYDPVKALQEINVAIKMMQEIRDRELLAASGMYTGVQDALVQMQKCQLEVIKYMARQINPNV